MNIYKVAIIGCGSIGANKPDHIDSPNSENVLTHAHAVSAHSRTELVAFVDIDKKKLRSARFKWNPDIVASDSIINLVLFGIKPDIVIIAVPTENHYEVLSEILNYQPQLIIAEKPFCNNSSEANDIIHQQKEKAKDGRRLPIMVDYIRRFAKGYQEIKKQIDSGKFGKAQNARVLYGRGLIREGCHAIDILRYFFGECIDACYETRINRVNKNRIIIDRNENDPSVHVCLEFKGCPNVIFQPCDGRKYGIFEIDICFENCRIRFIDNGLYYEIYPISEENEWGHKSLNYRLTDVIRRETGLNIALYNLIDNAVNFLDGKKQLLCTAEDAIAVHEILED